MKVRLGMSRRLVGAVALVALVFSGCIGQQGAASTPEESREKSTLELMTEHELVERALASMEMLKKWEPIDLPQDEGNEALRTYGDQVSEGLKVVDLESQKLGLYLRELRDRAGANEDRAYDARPRLIPIARVLNALAPRLAERGEHGHLLLEQLLLRVAGPWDGESLEPTGYYPCGRDCAELFKAYAPIQMARDSCLYKASKIPQTVKVERPDPIAGTMAAGDGACLFSGSAREAHAQIWTKDGEDLGTLVFADLEEVALLETAKGKSTGVVKWPFEGEVTLAHEGLFQLQSRVALVPEHIFFRKGTSVVSAELSGKTLEVSLKVESIQAQSPHRERLSCKDIALANTAQKFGGDHVAARGSRLLSTPSGAELGRLRSDYDSIVNLAKKKDGYVQVISSASASPVFDGWIRETFVTPLGPTMTGATYGTATPTHQVLSGAEVLTAEGKPSGLRLSQGALVRVYLEDKEPAGDESVAVAIPGALPADTQGPFRLPSSAIERLSAPNYDELSQVAARVLGLVEASLQRTIGEAKARAARK